VVRHGHRVVHSYVRRSLCPSQDAGSGGQDIPAGRPLSVSSTRRRNTREQGSTIIPQVRRRACPPADAGIGGKDVPTGRKGRTHR